MLPITNINLHEIAHSEFITLTTKTQLNLMNGIALNDENTKISFTHSHSAYFPSPQTVANITFAQGDKLWMGVYFVMARTKWQ